MLLILSPVATGQSLVTGTVSTQAAVLTHGVLKAMLITKLKIAGLILLAGGTAAIGSARRSAAHDGCRAE